jgi:hypothetical protein
MASVFFSYSHKDEGLRDQLETHLAGLKRQGLISAWHDRRIAAGREFGPAIDENLEGAGVILLLVSPDFIASDYCYEREMMRALERHKGGEARVVPVILRPCDWHDLPFGHLLATPRDGKPITTWPNIDQAFLDVVQAIKAALQEIGGVRKPQMPAKLAAAGGVTEPVIRSSNLRIRKEFSDLDKDRFRHDGFEFIAKFFEGSLAELVRRNPGLEQIFRRIDANRFAAALYQNGDKVCKGAVSLSGRHGGSEALQYVMTDDPNSGSMNEAVYVKADDETLYFEAMGMQSFGDRGEKLTPQGTAELFWDIFIRPLQPR